MHRNLYDRIVEYAGAIERGDPLPDYARGSQNNGLETAADVYRIVKTNNGLTAAEIATRAQISVEYAKQIVLALQNGGARIEARPLDSGQQHRHLQYF